MIRYLLEWKWRVIPINFYNEFSIAGALNDPRVAVAQSCHWIIYRHDDWAAIKIVAILRVWIRDMCDSLGKRAIDSERPIRTATVLII